MKNKWQQYAQEINNRFIKLAQIKGNLTSDTEMIRYLALAVCGEAGELANLIKKGWRGDDVNSDQIRDEIADIRIYLEHLARYLNFDLDDACENKLRKVDERLTVKEKA